MEKAGVKDIVPKVRGKVKEILKTHQLEQLDKDIKVKLVEIVKEANKKLVR